MDTRHGERMIPCYWHFGDRGSWCHEIVEFLTRGCEHRMGIGPAETAIVVVKADAVPSEEQLNADLVQIDRGVLIVTANEEGKFETGKITHPRMKVWLQTPAPHQSAHRYLPWGWTPHTKRVDRERSKSICFAGQKTHQRRIDCVKAMASIPDAVVVTSRGFSQGVSHEDYCNILSASKLAACPSGPITVDSFRVAEALECGTIPILDANSPAFDYPFYWERVFGKHQPLPIIHSWDTLPALTNFLLKTWAQDSEDVERWWEQRKKEWIRQLVEDLHG